MGLQRVGHYLETNLYTCCALVSHSVMSNSLRPHCLPGFSVHGILQARLLEWVASSFSRGSSWPRNRTWVSHIAGRFFTIRATWKHTHTHTHRRRQWHPSPVLLPGKSHGRRSLVGCSPWGCEESCTTERLHFHFSLLCIGEGNGKPLQCSCLENPRDGVAQSRTRLE